MNRSPSNSQTRAEARRPKRPNIREEARQAILVEQLAYLLSHTRSCRDDDCPDCARLRSVEQLLLEPFHVATVGTAVTGA